MSSPRRPALASLLLALAFAVPSFAEEPKKEEPAPAAPADDPAKLKERFASLQKEADELKAKVAELEKARAGAEEPKAEEPKKEEEKKEEPKKEEEKKEEPAAPADDPAKLKEQIAGFEKEIGELKTKILGLELDKLGASLSVDKTKDGAEVATVNILKRWTGEGEGLAVLKTVPNLQVVYIDNPKVDDAALAPLKELPALTALTVMSPAVTDAGLDQVKELKNLTMLFLTGSKVGDPGIERIKELPNLQVLALSRTEVTDAGLDALKDVKTLKSVYVIGAKVSAEAVEKLKAAVPGVAVYK